MRDSCSSQCFYSHMHNNDTPSCLEAQLSNYLLIVYVWRERFIYLTLYLIVLFSLVLYFKRRSQFEQTDWTPKTKTELGFICCDSVLLRELETQLSPSTGHNETSARLHLRWQCPAARTGNTAIAIYWPQRDFSSASSAVTVSCCENWKHSYRHLLTTTRLQLGFICCDSVLLRELETQLSPSTDHNETSARLHQLWQCVLLRELETQLSPSTGHNETSARLHLLWQCPAARTGNTAIAIYWPQRDFSSASSAVTVSCCENWKHSYRHLLATTRLQLRLSDCARLQVIARHLHDFLFFFFFFFFFF